jgi:hypothetical protein
VVVVIVLPPPHRQHLDMNLPSNKVGADARESLVGTFFGIQLVVSPGFPRRGFRQSGAYGSAQQACRPGDARMGRCFAIGFLVDHRFISLLFSTRDVPQSCRLTAEKQKTPK